MMRFLRLAAATGVLAAASFAGALRDAVVPGTPAPAFTVNTLDGPFSFTPGTDQPLVIMAWNQSDAFSSVMFSDSSSTALFLQQSPNDVQYLFLNYANNSYDARETAKTMQDALVAAANGTTTPFRLWFGIDVIDSLDFIAPLLANWTSAVEQVKAYVSDGDSTEAPPLTVSRFDSFYGWLPWPTDGGAPAPLVYVGDACNITGSAPAAANATAGAIVLAQYAGAAASNCTFAEMVVAAQTVGAASVLIINDVADTGNYAVMNCVSPADCALPAGIPLSMVAYADGQALRDYVAANSGNASSGSGGVLLNYTNTVVSGFFAGIDEVGLLQEIGWPKFASLQTLSWAGQWFDYYKQLRANLTAPALVLPVFTNTLMQGSPGIVVNVTMPPAAATAPYSTLEIDFALGCPTPYQASCAIWDRTVELKVCCDGGAAADASLCNTELGRWITPFRRGVGRWLTDVTLLRGLLPPGATCSFNVYTDSWAMPWYPSLALRWSNASNAAANADAAAAAPFAAAAAPSPAPPPGLSPLGLLPLWNGTIAFDQHYNNRSAVAFTVPTGTQRAYLYSVITGHGYDNNGCGEFCATSHIYTFNGVHANNLTYWEPLVDPAWGSTYDVIDGVIPNEHGTWAYGRDGWQDGNKVRPWIVDVTDQLVTADAAIHGGDASATNTVTYIGQFQGATPNPVGSPGYMILQSFVSFWG